MTPKEEVLLMAADYMDAHGKSEGALIDAHGRVCAIGAIRGATLINGELNVAPYLDTCDVLEDSLGGQDLLDWSDRNSKATVVAKMREVAEAL